MRFELNETENKKLLALFEQHEKNIDYLIYLRDLIWQEPHIDSGLFDFSVVISPCSLIFHITDKKANEVHFQRLLSKH